MYRVSRDMKGIQDNDDRLLSRISVCDVHLVRSVVKAESTEKEDISEAAITTRNVQDARRGEDMFQRHKTRKGTDFVRSDEHPNDLSDEQSHYENEPCVIREPNL